ncbi:MAG: SRPBCC domain-containing protein [Ignavibacteriales bacterium]|nr:SRPBCC domain-containing protein [Ignavibacteriales bacterium]
MTINKTQIVKDIPNKKLTVIREFSAPLEKVWRAWTESSVLDQWWAPRPWKAETKTMNFTEGGSWLYAMVGPDNSRHWAKVNFTSIHHHVSFQAKDLFCDENGNRNNDFPMLSWKVEFQSTQSGTKVTVEITSNTQADLEKIIAMGFEEGFTMAHGNLDEILEKSGKQFITVETTVNASVEKVWQCWTLPEHIMKWNNASDDWHTPWAKNDLRVGGKFIARMEAKDGSFGFDFNGIYDEVITNKLIAYKMEGGREVKITFTSNGDETKVVEIFEAETENSLELQRNGWQAILNNFKKYAETILKT